MTKKGTTEEEMWAMILRQSPPCMGDWDCLTAHGVHKKKYYMAICQGTDLSVRCSELRKGRDWKRKVKERK